MGGEAPLVRMQKPSLFEVGSLSQQWVFLLQIVFKSSSAPERLKFLDFLEYLITAFNLCQASLSKC